MNKYQLLKYAVIGLTTISHTASAASFLKPQLALIPRYTEPTKQVLIQAEKKPRITMNDKIYQTVKWLTIGILIGYAGKYALALFKAKRDQNSSSSSSQSKQSEIIYRHDNEY
ncbi:7802_t:CDS:2 [Entrophospora sp. SA101]|nr:7802_t:CDS:2 [Entrophospora sp. SA101]